MAINTLLIALLGGLCVIFQPLSFANDAKNAPALKASVTAQHTMDELRTIISEGLAAKSPCIVIPPGVYRGSPEPKQRVHLTISGASDTEIIADGVTMVCTDLTRAIGLSGCRAVTLRGLTVDYDPLPFTQGDVVAVSSQEGWTDVKIHAGYPLRADLRVDIVDRKTRYRKRDKPFMWGGSSEIRPNGIVRVTNKSAAEFAKVGDLASMGAEIPNLVAHTLAVEESDKVILQNVTILSSNCMGIVAAGGDGGHRFIGCRVIPGPPPVGATEARILSTDADAILTTNMREGVLTENCEIRDSGDDTWSVQSSDFVIIKRDGRTLWLAWRDSAAVRKGDRLQSSLDGPVAVVASAENVTLKGVTLDPQIQREIDKGGRWTYWSLPCVLKNGRAIKAVLDSDAPWKEGDSVYDIDRQGNGFVFRNNTVRSSGRILIKASGLVEGNRIEGPFAISAQPEVPACGGAVGIRDLVIRNNTVLDAHLFNAFYQSAQAGAISVTADGQNHTLHPTGAYGRVVIENNTIKGGNGAGIVVSSAREVVIKGNRLDGLLHIPPNNTGTAWKIDNHAAVWLSQCGHVTLAGNQLLNPGPHMSQPVVCGSGVQAIEGELKVSSSAPFMTSLTVPLSTLGLNYARQYGWWKLQPGRTLDKQVPTVNGFADEQGISARGESVVAFDLKGAGERLSARVGVDDEVKDAFKGPAECVVYGDGKELWRSGQLKARQAPVKLEVDLRGVKTLELVVEAFGDGIYDSHIDWLNATLKYAGEKPVHIKPPELPSERAILSPKPSATPRINGPRVFGVRLGAPFLFTIAASGQRPMTFSVVGLPDGLTLDSTSGRISGRLAKSGTSSVMLRAANALGAVERPLRIVVGEMLALSPPMGWSSWNCWGRNVDQEKVLGAARALVSSGLIEHGFSFVNIDDAWQAKRGGPFNALQGNEKFPDMKKLCDEIHRLGLKTGIYSTPWVTSYAGFPGGSSDNAEGEWVKTKGRSSIGKYSLMANDARQWAAWGFDYLKCDWHPPKPIEAKAVADALRKCGRDIVFSLSCDAPFEFAPEYAGVVNSFRTTTDIVDTWQSLSGIAFSQDRWAPFGGPGHWLDPDMMEVGQVNNGEAMHPTHLTPDEQYLHVSMWCLLSAPLILGCDLEKLDPFTLGLLTNDEVLDIDQDPLGKPARRLLCEGYLDVWVKELEDGSKAVGFVNRGRLELKAKIELDKLGLKGNHTVRDLWRHLDLGKRDATFETTVRPHGVVLVRMVAAGTDIVQAR